VLKIRNVIAAAAIVASSAALGQQNAAPKPITRSGISSTLDSTFAAADANHDGSLNIAEIQAVQARDLQQVTAQLRARLQVNFRQLDTNKDGQLSFAEYAASAAVKPNETPAQVLQKLDSNHDGKISAAEYKAPRLALFDRADLNHDGMVTVDEARRAAAGQK
jgi:Ca2+-binding EF-hand superfamily protein